MLAVYSYKTTDPQQLMLDAIEPGCWLNVVDILTQTVDAFGSIISNNLNVVVKLLTAMTIILTVPMLVASIFGMNVRLPFQNFEYGFWVVMGIMVLVAGAAVYIFWKRHWF